MACEHRFINDLYPTGKLEYLFVGTFNPYWDRLRNDNANWFYGRRNNDFWFIMPQVLGYQSLMDRAFRTDRNFLLNWCGVHNIGLTDLIECINDANPNDEHHKKIIVGVQDNAFDTFQQIQATKISEIIIANSATLQGVYLTRYEHTLLPVGIVANLWNSIKNTCVNLHIRHHDLVTPSRQYRAITRVQKLEEWRNIIRL